MPTICAVLWRYVSNLFHDTTCLSAVIFDVIWHQFKSFVVNILTFSFSNASSLLLILRTDFCELVSFTVRLYTNWLPQVCVDHVRHEQSLISSMYVLSFLQAIYSILLHAECASNVRFHFVATKEKVS